MTARERAEAALERVENGERTRDLLEELDQLAETVADDELRQRLTLGVYKHLDDDPTLFVDDPGAFLHELITTEGFEDGALITFGAVAEEPPDAFVDYVDDLLVLLTSGNDCKRGLALRCLYHLAVRSPRSVAGATHAFRACLEDTNPQIRGTACLALGVLEASDARGALEDRTRDDSEYVRGAAAWATARLEDGTSATEPTDSWDRSLFAAFDPLAFESLVADLWAAMGYRTEETGAGPDGGIDVIAATETERVAVQVKRYLSGPVTGPETQQLAGQTARSEFDRAVLVTSSGFTGPAERFADDATGVELIDGHGLCDLLDVNGLDPAAYRYRSH